MADQKELEEQVRQLTLELERLTKVSSTLGTTLDVLPRSMQGTVEKKLSDGVVKMFGNAARRAEEEAVKNARKAGANEQEALGARLATRKIHEQAAVRGLQELGAAAVKLGGQLYKGMDGISGFAQATESSVTAVAKFAFTLGGPVAKALSLLAVGLVKYASAAAEQSDKMYKAHKDLGRSGAAASDGLQGIYDMMQQFSLGVDELDKMTGLIAANSQSLAMFQGTVALGARALGKISGEIKDSGLREQFLAMGISVDEQREAAAGYLAIQTRLGRVQQQDTKALSVSIGEYIKETDAITKLTGAGRKEQEAARDKAMAIEQFRAHIMELENEGTVESIARSKELQKAMAELGTMKGGDQLQAQLAASVTGMITKATIGGQLATGGELTRIATDTSLKSSQIVEQFGGAIRKNTGPGSAFFDLAKTSGGVQDVLGLSFHGLMDFGEASKNMGARSQAVADEQGRMTNNLEASAAAQVKAEIANLDTRFALQGMVQMGVLPATEALSKLAQAAAWAASKAPQTDVGKPANARTTVERMLDAHPVTGLFSAGPKYTGPGSTNLMRTAPGTPVSGTAPGTPVAGTAAGTPASQSSTDKSLTSNQIIEQLGSTVRKNTSPGTAAAAGSIDSGPVFGSANRVQVTLTEIRDELKKLVRMGAIPGGGAAASGQAQVQAALTEHDHAHPHPPSADVSPELAAKIGALVNPLEKMNQTSGFIRNDGKTMHGAVDLAGKIGDKVMAPISGMAKVLSDPKGYGNYVEVTDTITGVKHILAHLDKTMIKTGDMVKAGQQVGTVGNTGMSTGPHLHHEIKLPDGTRVDPSKFYAGAARKPGAPAVAGAPGGAAGRAPSSADMTTYMRTVAMLESGGDPRAKNPRSSAGGLFQFLESSYEGVTGRKGSGAERFDPAKSTEAMAKFSADQKTQMEKNLGRGVSGADLYMGHFLGAGGATKFLGAKDRDPTQSAAKFDPAAAKANPEIYFNKGKERSMDEVYQLMTEKYRKNEASVMSGNIPALVASITGTGTLSPGGMAGPSGVPTPVAAAPGTTAALPAAPAATTSEQPQQPSTVAQQNSLMLQQLVTLNQTQNGLLSRILQTSQA